ncbi:MAG: DUF4185 domain-containing protein, partial [Opitutaceae bacterium]|nr:DUF4185 domain-containing protein [Verrucomicrobiales bacterium]
MATLLPFRQFYLSAAAILLAWPAWADLQPGGLQRQIFTNIAGTAVSDLTSNPRYPWAPDVADTVSSFESKNLGDNYGQRLSGYLTPPASGAYIFYLASDDQSQLWLSTDTNAANKQLIVSEPAWNIERNWQGGTAPWDANLYKPGRASGAISLEAGKYYYVEALHKEGLQGDSLAVAWKLPGGTAPASGSEPIGGQYLARAIINSSGGNPGSLVVTIGPAEAVAAGAQWQVNNGGFNVSGVTVSNLAAGSHTLSFRGAGAAGYVSPGSIRVIIPAGQVISTNITFAPTISVTNSGLAAPLTFAAFGHRVIAPGSGGYSNGDTWDGAWSADDTLYLQHNDGSGFNNSGYVHDRLTKLNGTPQMPGTLSGMDLNPGILGSSLNGPCYSTGTYEVDGVLYHNVCYSQQIPGAWVFHHTSTLKSTDGGRNWINHLGQLNVLPPDNGATCLFASEAWGQVNFVKYGRGGATPVVDNAQQYVYLTAASSGLRLARVARTNLAKLDRSTHEFYVAGDGMLDSSWTNDIARGGIVPTPSSSPTAIVYNDRLGRYLMTSFSSDSWQTPPIESTLRVMEAPHPWGPWTMVLEENVNHRESDNLTWGYLLPKFTSEEGKKMWLST